MSLFKAPARLTAVPAFCNAWGLDLTAGCEHACVYCPFERYQAVTTRRAHGGRKLAPTFTVDEFLQREDYPSNILLSPFTDPLAPAAGDNLELVLKRVLPRSVQVIVHTKGIVPRRVWRLLARHAELVRVIIGITSLNENRNKAVEPGCPSGKARLANFGLAREYGVTRVSARLDPILPAVDDVPAQMIDLLDRLTEFGIQAISASYLFLTPATQDRLRHTPYMGKAVAQCTELCPVEASPVGTRGSMTQGVYSVPLERKQQLYEWLHKACAARGLNFGTCGCKDLRLTGSFSTSCTYPDRNTCEAPSKQSRALSLPIVDALL